MINCSRWNVDTRYEIRALVLVYEKIETKVNANVTHKKTNLVLDNLYAELVRQATARDEIIYLICPRMRNVCLVRSL
jgi:hypothetical protein